jgi:hypothetical protein
MKRLSIVVGGRRNRHRDRNRDRVLQADNFDSDRDPDSDADILDCSFLFSEQKLNRPMRPTGRDGPGGGPRASPGGHWGKTKDTRL